MEEVLGEQMLSGLKICNVKTGQQSILELDGVFAAVGIIPNGRTYFDIVELDVAGYIITEETMGTSASGIFAAGDIGRSSARQIAAAVGDGVTAAMSTFKYVQEQGNGTRIASL